jgi:hypothetical protein
VQGQRVRSWLVAICLAACGAPSKPVAVDDMPAAPRDPPPHEATPARALPETLAAPRPTIDVSQWLPDLEVEARWPLGFNEHPIDEPSFDIAGALAEPGIGWRELCARGVQFGHRAKDQDLIRYLMAWCTQDATDALYQLGLLQSSPIRGIADAVAHDAARIVVGRVSGEDAEGALTRARLLDSNIVDLVAASYYEIGEVDDALVMNNVANNADRSARPDSTCHRLVRAIPSTRGDDQDAAIAHLHALATRPKSVPLGAKTTAADPTCVALDHAVTCSRGMPTCAHLVPGDPKQEALLEAYVRWPTIPAGFGAWYVVASFAANAMPSDEAFALLAPAFERALATSECVPVHFHQLETALAAPGIAGQPHASDVAAMQAEISAAETRCGLKGR